MQFWLKFRSCWASSSLASFSSYFQKLEGDWNLERKISDGSCFRGVARFSFAERDKLLVAETGKLDMANGTRLEASRNWIWHLSGEQQLEIFYGEDSQRLYHALDLSLSQNGWRGQATHLCEPDTYLGEYIFFDEGFIIKQEVSGPKKDYSMVSTYS